MAVAPRSALDGAGALDAHGIVENGLEAVHSRSRKEVREDSVCERGDADAKLGARQRLELQVTVCYLLERHDHRAAIGVVPAFEPS